MTQNITRLTFLLLIASNQCIAEPKIYSPIVKGGELAFEARGNITIDDDDNKDGAQRHVFEIEYGVNDWWKFGVFGRYNKSATGSLRYQLTGLENIIQLTEQGKYWLDAGIYLEYKFAADDSDPDGAEIKLLLEKDINDFTHTLNLILEQEVGSKGDKDLEFEYGWKSRKKITPHMKLGIEAFGKLGELRDIKSLQDQDHRLGPVFYHEFHIGGQEIEYNIGWLFGLTDASPDNTLRWQLEIPF